MDKRMIGATIYLTALLLLAVMFVKPTDADLPVFPGSEEEEMRKIWNPAHWNEGISYSSKIIPGC